MAVDIEQMRRDFPLAARQRGWSPQERAEYSALIKDATEAGDEAMLAYWAGELAAGAADWREFQAKVRAAEVRMHEAAQQAREG